MVKRWTSNACHLIGHSSGREDPVPFSPVLVLHPRTAITWVARLSFRRRRPEWVSSISAWNDGAVHPNARFSADQMHYAYRVYGDRRGVHTQSLPGCMRKGLRAGREIIDAVARWKSKRTATAALPSPMKRFKLSLPVDQRKGSDRWSHSYVRFVRNNRAGAVGGGGGVESWTRATHTQTTDQDLITTRRRISALQRNLGIPSSGRLCTRGNNGPRVFLWSVPLNFSSSSAALAQPGYNGPGAMKAPMRRFCCALIVSYFLAFPPPPSFVCLFHSIFLIELFSPRFFFSFSFFSIGSEFSRIFFFIIAVASLSGLDITMRGIAWEVLPPFYLWQCVWIHSRNWALFDSVCMESHCISYLQLNILLYVNFSMYFCAMLLNCV